MAIGPNPDPSKLQWRPKGSPGRPTGGVHSRQSFRLDELDAYFENDANIGGMLARVDEYVGFVPCQWVTDSWRRA